MKTDKLKKPTHVDGLDTRPWYKEPWPWVLIAIPLLTIIACGYTFYLAVSNPDFLVVEEEEYNAIVEELRAAPSPDPEQAPADLDGVNEHP